ncbi:MAG: hypothetical protein QOD06_3084 [Candidatus Binatota bacterium]|nr:hypothetical protein [Candidatus Binatota bacterium]
MKMTTSLVIAALAAMPLATASPAFAKGAKATKWSEERAVVRPDSAGGARALVRHRSRTERNGSMQANFGALVLVPGDERFDDMRLVLSRDDVDYAECFLVSDDDESEAGAVYQVDVRSRARGNRSSRKGADDPKGDDDRNKDLKERKGTCDVDLTDAAVTGGVPAVQSGDHVRVVVGADADERELVSGDFDSRR